MLSQCGARHSLRVSGAVFKVSDFEGVFKVSDFAPSKMRSVRFRVVCKVSGCEMSNFRNFEPSENFEPSLRIFEISNLHERAVLEQLKAKDSLTTQEQHALYRLERRLRLGRAAERNERTAQFGRRVPSARDGTANAP